MCKCCAAERRCQWLRFALASVELVVRHPFEVAYRALGHSRFDRFASAASVASARSAAEVSRAKAADTCFAAVGVTCEPLADVGFDFGAVAAVAVVAPAKPSAVPRASHGSVAEHTAWPDYQSLVISAMQERSASVASVTSGASDSSTDCVAELVVVLRWQASGWLGTVAEMRLAQVAAETIAMYSSKADCASTDSVMISLLLVAEALDDVLLTSGSAVV